MSTNKEPSLWQLNALTVTPPVTLAVTILVTDSRLCQNRLDVLVNILCAPTWKRHQLVRQCCSPSLRSLWSSTPSHTSTQPSACTRSSRCCTWPASVRPWSSSVPLGTSHCVACSGRAGWWRRARSWARWRRHPGPRWRPGPSHPSRGSTGRCSQGRQSWGSAAAVGEREKKRKTNVNTMQTSILTTK